MCDSLDVPYPHNDALRYDLLNRLYRACGQWEKALEVAEKNDRISLKSTHYAYAQVGCHCGLGSGEMG